MKDYVSIACDKTRTRRVDKVEKLGGLNGGAGAGAEPPLATTGGYGGVL